MSKWARRSLYPLARTLMIYSLLMWLKMIQVGEDAGAIDDMLSEIGEMTDAEVQDRVLKLTATLEPVITVIMGVMILVLALAIFLPIWDMYEALSRG